MSRSLRWLWLTLVVVILDRATKAWIESRPVSYFPHPVISNWFEIVYVRNPGIAFSFFAANPTLLARIALIAGATVIIFFIAWLLATARGASTWYQAGLALLLGGAAGNVTDRIVHGSVTDFLQVWLRFLPFPIFNPWPTFNVADAAVTIGAILLLIDVLFRPHAAAPK